MTHRKTAFGAVLLVAALSLGCAPVRAQLEAEFDRETVTLAPRAPLASDGWAVASIDGLTVEARWIGKARPLVTAYDSLGRVSRYVVPYTRRTWLVELRVTNRGPAPVVIKAEDWQLTAEPGALRRRPLALDYFKAHWPTEAVRSEAMMLDQSLAIGQIIRTLWGERAIAPGEEVTGILPFLNGPGAPTKVRLDWQQQRAISFAFGGEGA